MTAWKMCQEKEHGGVEQECLLTSLKKQPESIGKNTLQKDCCSMDANQFGMITVNMTQWLTRMPGFIMKAREVQ